MSGRTWARLALDSMAGGWVVAVCYAVAYQMGFPVPLWLLIAAYVLTALGRRVSRRAGIIVLCLVSAGTAVAVAWPPSWIAPLAALAVAYRAETVSNSASHDALRAEAILAMAVLLALNVWRLTQGVPPVGALVLPAIAVVAGGLFGLPYVHALDALGEGRERTAARPGLRLGGIVLALGACLGVLVALLRVLPLPSALSIALDFLYRLIAPVISLALGVVAVLLGGNGSHPASKQRQLRPKLPQEHLPKPIVASPAFGFWEHVVLASVLVALIAVVVYWLFRRQIRETEESGQQNAARAGEALTVGRGGATRRRPPAFGIGARARVRAAVGRHVLRRPRLPRDTARQVAGREGWPREVLNAYERARYRFSAPFEKSDADAFIASFRSWLQRRRGQQ